MIACTDDFPIGLTAVAAGVTYNINRPEMRLVGYDGTGEMNLRRLFQKAAGQRGTTDLGLTQGARYVSLAHDLTGRDYPHFFEVREEFLTIFQGREFDPIQLIFHIPGKGDRAADCNMEGAVDFLAGDNEYTHQRTAVQLKADDPRFYDPTQIVANLYPIDEAILGWLFPWPFPWTFSSDVANAAITIDYADGNRLAAPEYPVLRVHGPVVDPLIIQETTSDEIGFTGLSLGLGEYVTVDLSAGPYHDSAPTIRNHLDASLEHLLTSDDDLNTFHLAPAGELLLSGGRSDGNNTIRLQGTGATGDTRLEIIYYNRYKGF